MRLNLDCVRDLLLTVEETCDFRNIMRYSKSDNNFKRLKKYSHEEIIYHVNQCDLSGLLIGLSMPDSGDFFALSDLSPKGHQFVANIRDDTIFKKIKSKIIKIGGASLPVIMDLSAKIFGIILEQEK